MTHLIANQAKQIGDVASIGVVVGTLTHVLPALAALASITWTSIRIYETRTIQRMLGRKPRTRANDRADAPSRE